MFLQYSADTFLKKRLQCYKCAYLPMVIKLIAFSLGTHNVTHFKPFQLQQMFQFKICFKNLSEISVFVLDHAVIHRNFFKTFHHHIFLIFSD